MNPSSTRPTVSVIVPAANAADVVAAAVRSIVDQDYHPIAEIVVAVADDDTAAAVPRSDERVIVVENPAGTTPAGLNRALAATTGEVIVRCDAHAVLPARYVSTAVGVLEVAGAVTVGGRQIPVGRTRFERAVALAMTTWLGAGDARYRIGGSAGPVDTVYLGVFRRGALEAVGGFDETMLRNQDYAVNWRLRHQGGVVWFEPSLGVEYRPRGSVGALWRQYFDYGRGKRFMLARHPRSLRWRQMAAPSLVVALMASAGLAVMGRWTGTVVPVAYVTATALTSLADGIRRSEPAAVLEPLALWTMHLAWGTGFLVGPGPPD